MCTISYIISHREKESIERKRLFSDLGPYLIWNTACMLYDQTILLSIVQNQLLFKNLVMKPIFISFIIMWLCFLFLLVAYILRFLMKDHRADINPLPSLKFLFVYSKTVSIQTFLTFIHYPNFSIIAHHCINNDQPNGLRHETWSLDLVSTK